MYRLAHGLVLVSLLTLASAPARADLINFDDITDPSGIGSAIPNGYHGFNWFNFSAVNGSYYPPFSGYANGVLSSPMVAFNGNGDAALITSPTDFGFVGGNFTAAWHNGLQLRILGYDDGVQVYDSTFTLNAGSPTWINAGMSSIDQLLFLSSGGTAVSPASSGTQFALDDFTYTRDNGGIIVASLPEPGTLALLGLGVTGTLLGGLCRRRKKQPSA